MSYYDEYREMVIAERFVFRGVCRLCDAKVREYGDNHVINCHPLSFELAKAEDENSLAGLFKVVAEVVNKMEANQ